MSTGSINTREAGYTGTAWSYDLIPLATAEPEVLRIIGEESKQNGTDTMTPRQIDRIIKESARKRKALMHWLRRVRDMNVPVSEALDPEGLRRITLDNRSCRAATCSNATCRNGC